jgi:hypothetical protein
MLPLAAGLPPFPALKIEESSRLVVQEVSFFGRTDRIHFLFHL